MADLSYLSSLRKAFGKIKTNLKSYLDKKPDQITMETGRSLRDEISKEGLGFFKNYAGKILKESEDESYHIAARGDKVLIKGKDMKKVVENMSLAQKVDELSKKQGKGRRGLASYLTSNLADLAFGVPQSYPHEMGHGLVAEALGFKAEVGRRSMSFWGGESTPAKELGIFLGGPLMNLGLATALYGVSKWADKKNQEETRDYFRGLSGAELTFSSVNSLPWNTDSVNSILENFGVSLPANTGSDGYQAAEAFSKASPFPLIFLPRVF